MIEILISLLLSLPDQKLTPDTAAAHVAAATAASTDQIDAPLLLALAWYETRYKPTSVSRVRGKMFCGPLQIRVYKDRARCRELADLPTGYAAGASVLTQWLRTTRGNIAKALAHYVTGNVITERSRRYARGVLKLAGKLRR